MAVVKEFPAGSGVSREEVQRILTKRAEALARPLQERQTLAEPLELLVFSLAGERYAVDTAHVQDVVPLREITPLPCTPSFVLGVVNHRGRILPVLDFRRLFGLAGALGNAFTREAKQPSEIEDRDDPPTVVHDSQDERRRARERRDLPQRDHVLHVRGVDGVSLARERKHQ